MMVAACCATASACATLRFAWAPSQIVRGQYQMGYFEEPNGRATLVLDDAQHTNEPDVGLDDTGALSLPPGRSVGLPLADGTEYRVRVDDRPWAPFCVFGEREAMPDEDNRHGAFRLAGGRTAMFRHGGVAAVDWTVVRPWRDERQSLQALREGCATGHHDRLIVRKRAGRLEIAYGRCAVQLNDTANVMAVLAGPAWVSVEKVPAWQVERRVQLGALLCIVAAGAFAFALLRVAVGTAGATLLPVAAFGAAIWRPDIGIVLFAAFLLLGPVAAGLRMIADARRVPSRARARRAAGLVLVMAPLAAVLVPLVPARLLPADQFVGTPARCLLLGYSAIRGDGLRWDENRRPWVEHGGVWDILEQCSTCSGSFERRAKGAGRFSWVRDMVCSTQRSIAPGGDVVFFGGSNDDFVWRRFATGWAMQAIRLARYAYARPSATEFRSIAEAAAAGSLDALGTQNEALQAALDCIKLHGGRLRYFHDFFVWDLAEPRSEARLQMFSARAASVRAAGGEFVDVLGSVTDEAGTWWFNDYIHPSQIAHRKIGELMCRALGSRS